MVTQRTQQSRMLRRKMAIGTFNFIAKVAVLAGFLPFCVDKPLNQIALWIAKVFGEKRTKQMHNHIPLITRFFSSIRFGALPPP
jgi:hypothetical protein